MLQKLNRHPLLPGTPVTVFRFVHFRKPLIEGRAIIKAPIPRYENFYEVRFEGERRVRERLVHQGEWQSAPDRLLAELTAQWRASLTPELLREFFPDEVRMEEARHGNV